MKTIILKLLLLIPLIVFSHSPVKPKTEKEKIIKKTFEVTDNGDLDVSCTYADINITGWEARKVEIVVIINVRGNNEESIDNKLDNIAVQINQKGETISVHSTEPPSGESSGWLKNLLFSKTDNTQYHLTFNIKVPFKHNLNINNKYGKFRLNKLEGNLKINMLYGTINIGELGGTQNQISGKYISTSHLDFMREGSIEATYSDISIGQAYRLKITGDYTNVNIDKVRSISVHSDYLNLRTNNTTEANISGDYLNCRIAGVNKLFFQGDYGYLKVQGLKPYFDELDIHGDYLSLVLDNEENVAYTFDIHQDSASCFDYNNLTITNKAQKNHSHNYVGYYHSKNSKSRISIHTEYGCITLINSNP